MYNANGSIYRQGVYKDDKFQFAKKIEPEIKILIPDNAYASGDSWRCKSGYFKYGEACLKIPNNAYASGDSWKCRTGYEQSGNLCKKKTESKILHFDIGKSSKIVEKSQFFCKFL